jgi:hypothetical protein
VPQSYWIPIKKYGIGFPIVVRPGFPDWEHKVPNPDYDPEKDSDDKKLIKQPRFDFVIQFVWIEPETDEDEPAATPAPAGRAVGNTGLPPG